MWAHAGGVVAAAQLEMIAENYEQVGHALERVGRAGADYQGRLSRAEQVDWHSPAGDAFREVLIRLRHPGYVLADRAESTADQARTAARELRHYADRARQMGQTLQLFSDTGMLTGAVEMAMQLQINSAKNQVEQALQSAASFLGQVNEADKAEMLLWRAIRFVSPV